MKASGTASGPSGCGVVVRMANQLKLPVGVLREDWEEINNWIRYNRAAIEAGLSINFDPSVLLYIAYTNFTEQPTIMFYMELERQIKRFCVMTGRKPPTSTIYNEKEAKFYGVKNG